LDQNRDEPQKKKESGKPRPKKKKPGLGEEKVTLPAHGCARIQWKKWTRKNLFLGKGLVGVSTDEVGGVEGKGKGNLDP